MSQIVLDQSQDISGRDIHRLTSLYPPPDFVKTAGNDRLYADPESTPAHCFASPHNKLYPHHTAAATWMSTLFLLDKAANFDESAKQRMLTALEKAAVHFGIKPQFDALRAKFDVHGADELTKLSNDQFAIVWANPDDTVERHWPLRNALEVKAAAAHFLKYRDDFAFDDRCTIANRLLDKALLHGAAIDTEPLNKCAGRGACSARDAANLLSDRAGRVGDPELAGELEKMAEIIRDNPAKARGHENLLKLAGVIDGVDQMHKLTTQYADGLPRPEDVLFQVTEKAAQDFVRAHVETLTGNVYALDELEKASLDTMRDWMGDEFADAIAVGNVFPDGTKMAEIIPTLDRGTAGMFDRCMAELQIRPIMRDKTAAAEPLLSRERLFELADKYQPDSIL